MRDLKRTPIELVIFDLGGTIVDSGCQAPVIAVIQAFGQLGIVQAARNASVWAIGITDTGSEFGLTSNKLAALTLEERAVRHAAAEAKLRAAGVHAIVTSPEDLSQLVASGTFHA